MSSDHGNSLELAEGSDPVETADITSSDQLPDLKSLSKASSEAELESLVSESECTAEAKNEIEKSPSIHAEENSGVTQEPEDESGKEVQTNEVCKSNSGMLHQGISVEDKRPDHEHTKSDPAGKSEESLEHADQSAVVISVDNPSVMLDNTLPQIAMPETNPSESNNGLQKETSDSKEEADVKPQLSHQTSRSSDRPNPFDRIKEEDSVSVSSNNSQQSGSSAPSSVTISSTFSQRESVWAEYNSISYMLDHIPKKSQDFFSHKQVIITSMDAAKDYVVFGCNVGLLFVYDRKHNTVEKFKREAGDGISCVKLSQALDDQVAVGSDSGKLSLVLLHSNTAARTVKRVGVLKPPHVHKAPITCLEWSTNGMRVFSGDTSGLVICTHVDFHEGTVESVTVLKESHKVVQLSWLAPRLLVSTLHRSAVALLPPAPGYASEVRQLGTKDRSAPGEFGAVFVPGLCKPTDVKLYASRPGLRLWHASATDAKVHATLKCRETATKASAVKLQRGSVDKPPPTETVPQFGPLLWVGGNRLVTWSDHFLWFLEPGSGRCEGCVQHVGPIRSVASWGDEVYVLRAAADNRPRVVRLAPNIDSLMPRPLWLKTVSTLRPPVDPRRVSEDEQTETTPPNSPPAAGVSAKAITNRFGTLKSAFKRSNAAIEKKLNDSNIGADLERAKEKARVDLEKAGDQAKVKLGKFLVKARNAAETAFSTDFGVSEGARTSGADAQATGSDNEDTGSSRVSPEHASSEVPPIGKLDSVTLPKLELSGEVDKESGSGHHVKKDLAAAAEPDNLGPKPVSSVVTEGSLIAGGAKPFSGAPEGDLDIVFSQPKKRKKKKKKAAEQSEGWNDAQATETGPEDKVDAATAPDLDEETRRPEGVAVELSREESADGAGKTDDLETIPADVEEELDRIIQRQTSRTLSWEENVIADSFKSLDMSGTLAEDPVPTEGPENTEDNAETPEAVPETPALDEPDEGKLEEIEEEEEEEVVDIYSRDWSEKTFDSIPSMGSCDIEVPKSSELPPPPQQVPAAASRPLLQKFVRERIASTSDRNRAGVSATTIDPRLIDMWEELPTPGLLTSLAINDANVWATDASKRLSLSSACEDTVSWMHMKQAATGSASSPSGDLMWVLLGTSVYVQIVAQRRGHQAKASGGGKWREVIRNVASIAVDKSSAWYVKCDGDVMMQDGLRAERPHYQSVKAEGPPGVTFTTVTCRAGAVWAVSSAGDVYCRLGVTQGCPQGVDWQKIDRNWQEPVASVCLGDQGVGLALCTAGVLRFILGVTSHQAAGNACWWQVTLPWQLLQSSSKDQAVHWLTGKRDKGQGAGPRWCLAAGSPGVAVATGNSSSFFINRAAIEGHRWESAQVKALASTTRWSHLSAGGNADADVLWAVQPSGEILCISDAGQKVNVAALPHDERVDVISAGTSSVWVLTSQGHVYVKNGTEGQWIPQNTSQLENTRLRSVSCGRETVWACDDVGMTYFRIGSEAPASDTMMPAWVPADVSPLRPAHGVTLCRVYVSSDDKKVWAIDTVRRVYVRTGITAELPLGTDWLHVSGAQAVDVAVSSTSVHVLGPRGHVLRRVGVTQACCQGLSWRPVAASLTALSVSPGGQLWGLGQEGQLLRHSSTVIRSSQVRKQQQRLDRQDSLPGWVVT